MSRVVTFDKNAKNGTVTVLATCSPQERRLDGSAVASALATLINASGIAFAAVADNKEHLTVIAASGTTFTLAATQDQGGNPTIGTEQNGRSASISGTPGAGDTWQISLAGNAAGSPPTATLSSTGASTTAATLAASLSGNDYVAVAKGSVIYLARVSGNNVFVATASITPAGSSSQGTGLTHTLTLAGSVNVNDTWTLSLDGSALAPFAVASFSTDANAVAADFATKANAASGYAAFALANVVYITRIDNTAWLPSVTIARDPNAANATVSGLVKANYSNDIALLPADSLTCKPATGGRCRSAPTSSRSPRQPASRWLRSSTASSPR